MRARMISYRVVYDLVHLQEFRSEVISQLHIEDFFNPILRHSAQLLIAVQFMQSARPSMDTAEMSMCGDMATQ
jgi:hypothetical protein